MKKIICVFLVFVMMFSFTGCFSIMRDVVDDVSYSSNYDYSVQELNNLCMPDVDGDLCNELTENNVELFSEICNYADSEIGVNCWYIVALYMSEFDDYDDAVVKFVERKYYQDYLDWGDNYDNPYEIMMTYSERPFSSVESWYPNFVVGMQYEKDFIDVVEMNSDYRACIDYNGIYNQRADMLGITKNSDWRNARLSSNPSTASIFVPYGTSVDDVKDWYENNKQAFDEFEFKSITVYVFQPDVDFEELNVKFVNPYDDNIIHYRFSLL